MTDRPIIFSGPMIQALMDGRKTQARRVLTPQPLISWIVPHQPKCPNGWFGDEEGESSFFSGYQVGDRLWVREAFSATFWNAEHIDQQPNEYWSTPRESRTRDNLSDIYFKQSELYERMPFVPEERWAPSIFMPRWASRLTLIVTDVRVQRLQDISQDDAISEGNQPFFDHDNIVDVPCPNGNTMAMAPWRDPLYGFSNLWDGLYAKRGYGWDENPWVVAITFDVLKQNIDEVANDTDR